MAIGADRINGKSPVRRRFFLLVAVMAFQTGRVDLRASIDNVRRSDIIFVGPMGQARTVTFCAADINFHVNLDKWVFILEVRMADITVVVICRNVP